MQNTQIITPLARGKPQAPWISLGTPERFGEARMVGEAEKEIDKYDSTY